MASSSSSAYLPDYTTLWAKPFEPHFPRPPSPPRRATSTANDSRRQAHEQTLRQIAHARSVYHHASGSHLPARRSRRYRADHRAFTGLDDGAIKEQVKLQERESGYAWNGSGTTEQEEREIEEEEDLRMQWRENLLLYGRSSIVLLGRGKTMQEETQDAEDREAIAAMHGLANNNNSMVGPGGVEGPNAGGSNPAAGVAGATDHTTAGIARTSRRGRHRESRTASEGAAGGTARSRTIDGVQGSTTTTTATAGAVGPATDVDHDDVYAGEYTLDDGDASGYPTPGAEYMDRDLDAGMRSVD